VLQTNNTPEVRDQEFQERLAQIRENIKANREAKEQADPFPFPKGEEKTPTPEELNGKPAEESEPPKRSEGIAALLENCGFGVTHIKMILALLVRDKDFYEMFGPRFKPYDFSTVDVEAPDDIMAEIWIITNDYFKKFKRMIIRDILKYEIASYFKRFRKDEKRLPEWYALVDEIFDAVGLEEVKDWYAEKMAGFLQFQELKLEVNKVFTDIQKKGILSTGSCVKEFHGQISEILELGRKDQNILDAIPTFNDIPDNVDEDWLVEGLIPRGAITVLYGKRGLAKSHLIYDIGKCVAEGIPFLGHDVKQAPVYYIDFENPLPVRSHMKKISGGSGVKVWALDNKMGPPPRLDSKDWEVYKSFPPGLVIYDTFRASQQKNTQDDTDMTVIMNRLKELWAKGFTVVILLHTLKLDDRMWKGNTVIFDLSDHSLALFKVKSPGEMSEAEDDDDPNKPKLLFFGCLPDEKSRFRKSNMYLVYDPEKGFSSADNPDQLLLNQILDRFNDWVFNEKKNKGRDLEPQEYPNRETFEKCIVEWMKIKPNKARGLIPKGLNKFWRKDEVRISSVTYHFYFPLIVRNRKS
jgi:hypothetical protein